jgi:nicotinate phosphoribosyltransferase
LRYLKDFSFRPSEHVKLSFHPQQEAKAESGAELGAIELQLAGTWLETILYEIPLLALISETYFRFRDTDWSYEGQLERAREKGQQLLRGGCVFSEFGSRRRRSYKAQELVLEGLVEAAKEGKEAGWSGLLSGSSNVHFAHRFGLNPVGTVAHEWFMGIAAITNDYEHANETALSYWVGTFGEGVSSLDPPKLSC